MYSDKQIESNGVNLSAPMKALKGEDSIEDLDAPLDIG